MSLWVNSVRLHPTRFDETAATRRPSSFRGLPHRCRTGLIVWGRLDPSLRDQSAEPTKGKVGLVLCVSTDFFTPIFSHRNASQQPPLASNALLRKTAKTPCCHNARLPKMAGYQKRPAAQSSFPPSIHCLYYSVYGVGFKPSRLNLPADMRGCATNCMRGCGTNCDVPSLPFHPGLPIPGSPRRKRQVARDPSPPKLPQSADPPSCPARQTVRNRHRYS